jgi:adenylate cyclase
MLADRDEPLSAVRRQTVAVLFAEVVGFTRMSEAMPPEAVVAMLRQLHDRMTAQIFACSGSIEKYAGDEIFAVFGIPEAGPNDAADALDYAVRMLNALADWNREREAAGDPPLAMGIGIITGLPSLAISTASKASRSASSAIPSTPQAGCKI